MAAKGMGGPGGFDMNALLQQAQKMQQEMVAAQEALKDEEVEASAGGGMVKVKMSGDLKVTSVEIDPEVASDPDAAEILPELLQAAVNVSGLPLRRMSISIFSPGRARATWFIELRPSADCTPSMLRIRSPGCSPARAAGPSR